MADTARHNDANSEAPATLFVRVRDIVNGQVTATTYPFPEGEKYVLAPTTGSGGAREEYARKNPLGGPARVFEAIAERIRAGEDYYEVLRDYDLQHVSPATASTKDEEIERLRVQLAGCGVAAMGGTSEDQVVERGAYGWSQSYDDVLSLRRKYDALISETPASETAKPTSEQQQRGVEAYQQWRANSDNRESSAYGGNLHDLARRMYESMR